MHTLVLARHAHSVSNASDVVSGVPPGAGLSPAGVEQARRLGDALAGDLLDVGLATRLRRTQETLALALDGRGIETGVFAGLDEIRFGSFEGGPLGDYRAWAWTTGPADPCPGGGESRADAARRLASALDGLVARPQPVIVAVSHALPIRYVLDAARSLPPARRIEPVPHAEPFRLDADDVEAAARVLRQWAERPRFREE